jgi:hypothetical protein
MNIVMIPVLDKQILDYLPLLGKEEKQSLISVIKSFLHLKQESDAHMGIEQYNKELAEAEAEYANGEYITHEQMKNKLKQWEQRRAK